MHVYKQGKRHELTPQAGAPQQPRQQPRPPKNSRENFGSDNGGSKKKCPTWLWYVIAGLGAALVIGLIVWLIRSRNKEGYAKVGSSSESGSPVAGQKFGFRFY